VGCAVDQLPLHGTVAIRVGLVLRIDDGVEQAVEHVFIFRTDLGPAAASSAASSAGQECLESGQYGSRHGPGLGGHLDLLLGEAVVAGAVAARMSRRCVMSSFQSCSSGSQQTSAVQAILSDPHWSQIHLVGVTVLGLAMITGGTWRRVRGRPEIGVNGLANRQEEGSRGVNPAPTSTAPRAMAAFRRGGVRS